MLLSSALLCGSMLSSSARPLPLWVVNVSSVAPNLLPLFATTQGVINRHDAARVLLVGMAADKDKLTGADAAALSLDFIRGSTRYRAELEYSAERVLNEPWALFAQSFVPEAATHVVLCDVADAPHALYAALTLAAAHGGAAAVCVSAGEERSMVLERSRLRVDRDLSGLWPLSSYNSSQACAAVNAYIDALLREGVRGSAGSSAQLSTEGRGAARSAAVALGRATCRWVESMSLRSVRMMIRAAAARGGSQVGAGNFSSSHFATWGASVAGMPTQGYDFAISQRMVTLCLDAAAADWSEGGAQWRLLKRYPPLSFGFGWWTNEDADVTGLSRMGLTWLGGGHNLALFSRLPALTATPQPQTPSPQLPHPSPHAALAIFSFSQGDAASFDQKFDIMNLRARSLSSPNRSQVTVASRYPFSLMATPLDATVQPNVAAEIRQLQGTQQWLLGKPYGYSSVSALDDAGVLSEYLQRGRAAMDRLGWLDMMLNEPPSARLNSTVTRVLELCANTTGVGSYAEEAEGVGAATWPRAVLLKHPLRYPWKPGAKIPGRGGATELPQLRGPGPAGQGGQTVVLSDPVKAVSDPETRALDVDATVAQVPATLLLSCHPRAVCAAERALHGCGGRSWDSLS